MRKIKEKDIVRYIIFIILILLSAAIHLRAHFSDIYIKSNNIILGLYSIAIILWLQIVKNKFAHRNVNKLLHGIAFSLLAIMCIRTIRYEIIIENSKVGRFIWYSYYVIIISIIMMLLNLVLHIGKFENEDNSPLWKLLYIPTLFFIILVWTNDYHQLIFKFFVDGEGNAIDTVSHGIFFYLMISYIGIIFLTIIYITYKKYYFKDGLKRHLLPFIPIILLGTYTLLYISKWEPFTYFVIAFKSPEFNTIMTIFFVDSLIYSGMLPTNTLYEEFWEISSLNMGIIDDKGKILTPNKSGKNITRD